MNRKTLVAAATMAVTLAAPTVASADYYISKGRAESFARSEVHRRYVDVQGSVGTFCRPQGLQKGKRGYVYHRWTCAWVDDVSWGRFLIAGNSNGHDYYFVKVVTGITQS